MIVGNLFFVVFVCSKFEELSPTVLHAFGCGSYTFISSTFRRSIKDMDL